MPEKYQDEIEEILKGIEEDEPPRPARRSQPVIDDLPRPADGSGSPNRAGQETAGAGAGSRWRWATPGRVALGGLIFLLLGLAFRSAGLGWLVWLGLLGLAAAYLLFFVRPRPVNRGKRWRGRSVESRGLSPWQRFKRWMSE